MKENKQLRKVLNDYNMARIRLIKARDEAFPPGCKVKHPHFVGETTVRKGSLHACNVLTDRGHIGITFLERVDDD